MANSRDEHTIGSHSMSGLQRLSVFAVLTWMGFWAAAFLLDGPPFSWGGFVLFGALPAAVVIGVPWGVWWVIAGFRPARKS